MDTSETYVKMCEKATEIQNLRSHRFEMGDYIDIGDIPQTVAIAEDDEIRDSISIWLPRQDQLQEMMGGLKSGFIDWINWLGNIYGYNYGDKPNGHLRIFTTWEQLWLAFVMHELYSKVWNDEDWIQEAK